MEHQIPQSFKVQWLNTTLKFIKDDTQLVKDYPEMPSSHVEYLHNLIWQRKNNVGLGFKSLYAPVWEAMKIYSVKYKFKIVVEKSEDGESGHLKMEKIPKTGQSPKELNDEKNDKKNDDENKVKRNNDENKVKIFFDESKDKRNNDENKVKKNSDEKKEKENKTIQNCQVSKELQNDTVTCKQKDLQSKKTKTKKSPPKVSKGLKIFMENQQLLDSLSPLFIKEKLKSILDFITDESSASKIFLNLAPMESRFLENFPSIYQRKNDLGVLLSPASNEILTEISKCFENFCKTCNLDISVGINGTTNKREVKYTKVPVFPTKKKTKQKLKGNSIETNFTNTTLNETTNMPSISKEESIMEKNVSKEPKKSKSKNKTKISQKNATDEDKYINEPIDKVIRTIDNNIIDALSKVVKNDDVEPKTSYLKDTSLNKSVLLPKKSINFTKEGTSRTVNTTHIKVTQKSPKMKILQDMSVPLTSDKGLRMMQLMGWKGGALGLRGEGILEPIIPIPNHSTSGLGHVPSKTDSNKEIKKLIRTEFVNKVVEMIDNDIKISAIKVQDKLIKREIKFLKLTLRTINKRMNLGVEFDNRDEIKDKMINNPDIIFDIDFEDDYREIILTKTFKTAEKINKDIKKDTNPEDIDIEGLKNKNSEASFKTIVLKSILELIKSEDKEKLIQFNKDLKTKHINYSNIIILLINERQNVRQKRNQVVNELGAKVLEEIGDIQLSVKIKETERYIVIKKKHPNDNSNKDNKTESDEKESPFDNVRSNPPTKKKYKILNALYKYEEKHTEEFKENQWYNTEDKSLLDNTKINENIKINNENVDNPKSGQENNKNKRKNIDHNNNKVLKTVCKYPENVIQKSDLLLQALENVQN